MVSISHAFIGSMYDCRRESVKLGEFRVCVEELRPCSGRSTSRRRADQSENTASWESWHFSALQTETQTIGTIWTESINTQTKSKHSESKKNKI